jgi:hypothetical protein
MKNIPICHEEIGNSSEQFRREKSRIKIPGILSQVS